MTKKELTTRLRSLEARRKALVFDLEDHVTSEALHWGLIDIDDLDAAEAKSERASAYVREAKDISLKAGNVYQHATIKKDEQLMNRAKRLVNGLADMVDRQVAQTNRGVKKAYGV